MGHKEQQVLLAILAIQAIKVLQAQMAHVVPMDHQELLANLATQDQLAHLAIVDKLEDLDLRVPMVPPDTQDTLDLQDSPEGLEQQEIPERQDHLDSLEIKDTKGHLEVLDRPDLRAGLVEQATPAVLDIVETTELMDRWAQEVPWELQVSSVDRDSSEQRAPLVTQEHLDRREIPVTKVPRDRWVQPEPLDN